MSRLTYKLGNDYGLNNEASAKVGLFTDYDGFFAYLVAINKLGKYEDTGLEPTDIIHCKDCKFYHKDGNWCDLNSHFLDEKDEPTLPSESSSWREFVDDDYCSRGERNEK